MKNKLLIAIMLLFSMIGSVMAQDNTLKGVVTGADDGQGIPGVNVVVEGTTSGTTTDVDGNYALALPDGAKSIVFTFVG